MLRDKIQNRLKRIYGKNHEKVRKFNEIAQSSKEAKITDVGKIISEFHSSYENRNDLRKK